MYDDHKLLDIRSRIKAKIISLFSTIPDPPIVLVLDSVTSLKLASCVQLSDLNEAGIFLIEDIDKKRKPLPTFCAVYLVSSIDHAFEAIASDWQTAHPRYKSGHIFYSEVPSDMFWEESQTLRSNPCIKSIAQMFLSLHCSDAYTVHFGMHLDMVHLLSHNSTTVCHHFAQKVFHVLEDLGYVPSIRHQRSQPAMYVAKQLEEFFQMQHSNINVQNSTECDLLIFDRSIDVISPIAHDFSYEKVLQEIHADYVDVLTDKNFEHSYWDPIWNLVRHLNINCAHQALMGAYSQFRQRHSDSVEQSLENQSIAALMQVAHEAPGQQRVANELEIHMRALKSIFSWQKDSGLSAIFEIEQIMIEKIINGTCLFKSNEIDDSMQELSRMKLPIAVRQRIVYIYALTLSEKDTSKLELFMNAFEIPRIKLSAIKRLRFLHERGDIPLYGKTNHFTNIDFKDFNRRPTKLKQISKQLLNDTLRTDVFPYAQSSMNIPISNKSNRTRTLILLVVGGFTTAELHDMHQLRQMQKCPIIMLSSSDVRAKEFLYELDLLSL